MPRSLFPLHRLLSLAAAGCAGLMLQACQGTQEPPAVEASLKGPMPAFRSVLDGRSRVLTVRLDDDIRVAYDTDSGHLYKAWEGDLELKGAVFDRRHGPQPTSDGGSYLINESAAWLVQGEPGAQVRYSGYRVEGDQVSVLYRVSGQGWKGDIIETPGYQRRTQGIELVREFIVSGLPDGVTVSLGDMEMPASHSVSGPGTFTDTAHVQLSNGTTRLALHYPDLIPPEPEEEELEHPGLTLIKNDDCAACHNPEVSTVGPSYVAMARVYDDDPATVEMLAHRIIDGGSGNWGQVPMTPHPDLSLDQAEQMVHYILSLAEYEGSEDEDKEEPVAEKIDESLLKAIPGDQREVAGLHPSFDLFQARPHDFEPMVGGIDFMPDGRMVVTTWDPEGSVYLVENYTAEPQDIKVTRIARGLAEPLGVKVVDGDIYVMQKQELTKLVDSNGDGFIDTYQMVANDWSVTDNFHEFAFGLEYQDGYFYATLAVAVLPGGASADPQAPDRGKVAKIRKADGHVEFIAEGLRTPNGIGFGIDGGLFISDNEGDWLPSSKIVELTEGAFYGSRAVDFEGTAGLQETLPVVWLPQDEIGNSPGEPAPLNIGPYQNQMIHGEVTHGGIKRVFAERVNGRLQGAVFRFTQGLEAGINRLDWAPDGSLIAGGVGNPGNWGHQGKNWYGLQRLVYNGETAFEMLSVSARSNGFEIEFTQPIKEGQNINADDFKIQQWYYEPTEQYGGPKNDLRQLEVSAFSLSDDRTRASFELDGMKPGHVVYFRITRPFVSETDTSLWTTEAWYTLNAIPEDKPVQINPNYQVAHNQLTETEVAEGWQLLFDGKSLEGLRSYNSDTLGERWVIDNGTLHMSGLREGEEGWRTPEGGGDAVITPQPVENFELYLEWKISEGGNSGIIYNVKERPDLEHSFLSGPEYQILDNAGHPDGQIETHRAGDNYDLVASKFVAANPPGEWNRTRLIVDNGHVQHWLNGYKVVEIEMWSDEWDELIANSKFHDWEHFAKSPGGIIVLQDHADKVWFRNIKLKEL
jgi:cytochrome c551/c552